MKTKKYLKIASLAVVAAIFIWTFVFLYRKSQPTVKVYETIVPETADLEKTTVATGKVEPRDEVLIKPQISGIISEVYKEAGQSVKQGEVIAKVKVIPELGTLNSAESRVRLFAERGYDVKYRVRADYEHFLYCIYDRKAEAVYVEMIVADYEGGGFSETRENRRISEKEHAEITKRYLGRDKALRYKLLMLLTLAPLRTKLAEDEKYSEWYNGIKAKIYGRCGHKDEPGENRK